MLTPAFELTQDDNFVVIHIKTPHMRIPTDEDDEDVEVFFQDRRFEFYAKPYLLRLTLPGSVLTHDHPLSKAQFIAAETAFIIHMPKATRGEHFDGLDLLTKLLTPPKQEAACSSVPFIEVFGGRDDNLNPADQDDVFDWSLPQPLSSENVSFLGTKYGFANQYHNVISNVQDELSELVQIRSPDRKSFSERSEEREEAEAKKFDEEHYLADFYDDGDVKKVIEFDPPWVKLCRKLDRQQSSSSSDLITFTEDEKEMMASLPAKGYLLDKSTKTRLLFGLVDILFGYAYDMRTMEAEHSVESSWTICRLSATLSWLETCTSLFSTCVTCVRRSLCYPLYRNWDLAILVLKDVAQILRLGQKYVLKCLLDIRDVLNRCEYRYVLNELYITDYCIWIQSVKSETLQSLAEALANVKIAKDDVKLDLVRLHFEADKMVREEIVRRRRMERNLSQRSGSSRQAPDAGLISGGPCVSNQGASVDPLVSDLNTLEITTGSQAGNLDAASQSSSDDDDDDDDDSSASDSDSSSDRTDSDDDDSADSDDCTSSEVASSDSDDDDDDDDDDSSSDSDSSDESCTMLLKTMKNTERKR